MLELVCLSTVQDFYEIQKDDRMLLYLNAKNNQPASMLL